MSSETTDSRASKLRETALAIIDAFQKWDLEAIMALRTDDCTTQVLPRSLSRPRMNNADYREFFGGLMPHFRDFTLAVDEVIVDAPQNKVAVWCRSTADTEIGPYANEYVLILYLNEAGDKVYKYLEFVDSNNTVSFFPKLREHIADKAGVDSMGS
ncbi:hypothetical protein F4777DRAFT_556965 [Nemania sp. FL0916]|nr:hypothetical protein F4777DRAFT_556965 [Nemania sp. FL0916]